MELISLVRTIKGVPGINAVIFTFPAASLHISMTPDYIDLKSWTSGPITIVSHTPMKSHENYFNMGVLPDT